MDNKILNRDSTVSDAQPNNNAPEMTEDQKRQMQEQVDIQIQQDQGDPRQQTYLKNATTGRLIKSREQYEYAIEQRQGVERITYGQALALYTQEKSLRHKILNEKKKRKRIKAARKVNRG